MSCGLAMTKAVVFIVAFSAFLCVVESNKHQKHCPKNGTPQSYLWQVRKKPPAYVFGTVHVANDAIWPQVPTNVKHAWRQSDAVYAELDWSDGNTQVAVRQCRHLPDGQTIDQILPGDVYERLRLFMKHIRNALPAWVQSSELLSSFLINWKMQKKQLFKTYVGDWKRKRPIWALLLVNDLSREKVENSGHTVLDENLLNEAKERGQTTGALETAAEQCGPLNGLDEEVVIEALNKTLEIRLQEDWDYQSLVDATPSPKMSETDALIVAYNCGQFNNKRLIRKLTGKRRNVPDLGGTVLEEFDNLVESSLVVGRNRELAKTVNRLLRIHKDQSIFFAMGVAHLVGNETVLTNLKKMGHRVDQVSRTTQLQARPPLKPLVGPAVLPPPIASHGPSQSAAGGVKTSKPGWNPAFSATPNDWASAFTGKLNKLVKNSIRKPPTGVLKAVPLNPDLEQSITTMAQTAEINQALSSSTSRPSPRLWELASGAIFIVLITFM